MVFEAKLGYFIPWNGFLFFEASDFARISLKDEIIICM